jgi:nucleotide-binding universal stress UspA family protein
VTVKRVVVGMDFSEPSVVAARWTKQFIAPGAEYVFANAITRVQTPSFLRELYPPPEDAVERARENAVARFSSLASAFGEPGLRSVVEVGRPDEVLCRVAEQTGAALIVTAMHGESTQLWKVLGSTAERLVRRAPVSVLIARGLPKKAPRVIVVALGESEANPLVIEWAAEVAQASNAKVVALHVGPPIVRDLGRDGEDEGPDIIELRQRTEAWIAEQLSGTALAGATTEVVFGEPAVEIDRAMERLGGDLLIIARRGDVVTSGTFMGETAESVIRNGRCAVLVVAAPVR